MTKGFGPYGNPISTPGHSPCLRLPPSQRDNLEPPACFLSLRLHSPSPCSPMSSHAGPLEGPSPHRCSRLPRPRLWHAPPCTGGEGQQQRGTPTGRKWSISRGLHSFCQRNSISAKGASSRQWRASTAVSALQPRLNPHTCAAEAAAGPPCHAASLAAPHVLAA